MILLDSQAFIWLLNDRSKVGARAVELIETDGNLLVSVISIWELGLKHLKHESKQPIPIDALIEGAVLLGAEIVGLRPSHLIEYPSIDLPQKDPFDNLLIAQSQAEGAVFLTADQQILASKYKTIDARK